jgi:hypothetical protein
MFYINSFILDVKNPVEPLEIQIPPTKNDTEQIHLSPHSVQSETVSNKREHHIRPICSLFILI